MTNSRINYTLVGGFVLLMLATLFGLLLVLGGRGGSTEEYHVLYDNVGGLKFGTQVLYEGFPIGQVEEIIPRQADGKTRFQVVLAVRKGWQIPVDSVARVAATGFLSAVAIDIAAGTSAERLSPGQEIPGQAGGNLFAAFSAVAGEVNGLSRDGLRPLLAALTQVVASLGEVAGTEVPAIARNLRQMSDDLAERTPRIAGNLASFSDKLDSQVMSDANVASLQRVLANTEQATREFSVISQNLSSMSQNVQALSAQLDGMVKDNRSDLRDTVKDMRYSLDSIARSIDSITSNMDSTSRNMSEFSRSLRQNPGLLLGGTPQPDEQRRR